MVDDEEGEVDPSNDEEEEDVVEGGKDFGYETVYNILTLSLFLNKKTFSSQFPMVTNLK